MKKFIPIANLCLTLSIFSSVVYIIYSIEKNFRMPFRKNPLPIKQKLKPFPQLLKQNTIEIKEKIKQILEKRKSLVKDIQIDDNTTFQHWSDPLTSFKDEKTKYDVYWLLKKGDTVFMLHSKNNCMAFNYERLLKRVEEHSKNITLYYPFLELLRNLDSMTNKEKSDKLGYDAVACIRVENDAVIHISFSTCNVNVQTPSPQPQLTYMDKAISI